MAASSDGLRRSLVLTFGIALAGGLVLALLTIGYILRLERELEHRLDENARARADLQELSARLLRAQENERRTLARELHDEVGQSLSAILMEAESASCSEVPGEMRDHLAAIRTLAEKTVNEVRDVALPLRPSMPTLAPPRWWSGVTAIGCSLRFATTARVLTPASSVAWACWAWRNESGAWAVASASTLNLGAAPRLKPSCRWPNSWRQMDMMPIRILLADDHTVARDGLRALLEREPDMTVVAEAADGRDSVRLAEE